MSLPATRTLATSSLAELRELVGELLVGVAESTSESRALRAEVARLKGLPSRPPSRPWGMERATGDGAKRDRDAVNAEVLVKAAPPPELRFKGYHDILVRELAISAEVVRYRLERWAAPSGERVLAPMPAGIGGGFGPGLRRFLLVAHAQGQVTTERLVALLGGIRIEISKCQMARLLTWRLDGLIAEDQTVLQAGLSTARWVTVDDTAARHARRDAFTTQIGDARFTAFRTGASKSRQAFPPLLPAGYGEHALCWVEAERLVHTPVPANNQQRRSVERTQNLIWWLDADLKAWKRDRCRRRAAALRARSDRIFTRHTGYVLLDRLLARLRPRTAELLRVLTRADIALHTNGSENDIRACVTKRKVSGGTISADGREVARLLATVFQSRSVDRPPVDTHV